MAAGIFVDVTIDWMESTPSGRNLDLNWNIINRI
jgi:hypothetical protein